MSKEWQLNQSSLTPVIKWNLCSNNKRKHWWRQRRKKINLIYPIFFTQPLEKCFSFIAMKSLAMPHFIACLKLIPSLSSVRRHWKVCVHVFNFFNSLYLVTFCYFFYGNYANVWWVFCTRWAGCCDKGGGRVVAAKKINQFSINKTKVLETGSHWWYFN